MKSSPILAAVVAFTIHTPTESRASYDAQDGDIIFHRSQSAQSGAIAAATSSRYTHVGIILVENGREMVYEACGYVKATPLDRFIRSGENGAYVIKRLKDRDKLNIQCLKREVKKMRGRRYDKYFDWSDSTIYCSELVWKAYERSCDVELGRLRKMKDFNLKSTLVKNTLKSRYGSKVPLDMTVIAPSDIYSSRHLKTVASEGGTISQITSFLGRLVSDN